MLKQENVKIREIQPQDDLVLAKIIRNSLKSVHLDHPGTAYFDENLDHLSQYYQKENRWYWVLEANQKVMGGIGLERFVYFPNCLEIQKCYLCPEARNKGWGYRLLEMVEQEAVKKGYEMLYLETHSILKPAIALYRKRGFQEIEHPACIVHSKMDRFFIKRLEAQPCD